MSTERRTTVSNLMHSKWMLPGFSVLIGLVYLGAAIVGGDARLVGYLVVEGGDGPPVDGVGARAGRRRADVHGDNHGGVL